MHSRLSNMTLGSAAFGGAVWLVQVAVVLPSLFHTDWAVGLLLLGPLVLVPLGLRLLVMDGQPPWFGRTALWLQLPAALLLVVSFRGSVGPQAAALALPWLAVTGLLAAWGLVRLCRGGRRSAAEFCADAGLVYLAIGGSWTVLSRFGARPLDFEPIIVLLTAIHFHYAGFVLPLLTSLAGRELPGVVSRSAALLVVVSVPLVAAGITASQLEYPPPLEAAAALLMALGGTLTACLHARLALQSGRPRTTRALWGAAAASLAFGMVLSALYGLRSYGVTPGLDIPWMRALHGTANALGFALAGLIAWNLSGEQQPPDRSDG